MKKMLTLSFLFHAGLVVLVMTISLRGSSPHWGSQVYQVNLVSLPRPATAPPEAVQEKPQAPNASKKEVKAAKKPAPHKIAAEKLPIKPPPKPIEPVAVVPPPVKSKKEAPEKPEVPPATKPSVPAAAIPSPETQIKAGIEAPNFQYPYYLDLIQRKIGMYWSPPPLESAAEGKEAVVGFVLFSNGKVAGIKIEKSSGNAFFDQAALRAVYQANPLPPLPQEVRDESLKVHFSFSLMKKS